MPYRIILIVFIFPSNEKAKINSLISLQSHPLDSQQDVLVTSSVYEFVR